MKEKKLNIRTAKKLIFICFSMFLFSFALIPLYNVICDVTGLLLKNVIERNLWIKTVFNPEIPENMKTLYSE